MNTETWNESEDFKPAKEVVCSLEATYKDAEKGCCGCSKRLN